MSRDSKKRRDQKKKDQPNKKSRRRPTQKRSNHTNDVKSLFPTLYSFSKTLNSPGIWHEPFRPANPEFLLNLIDLIRKVRVILEVSSTFERQEQIFRATYREILSIKQRSSLYNEETYSFVDFLQFWLSTYNMISGIRLRRMYSVFDWIIQSLNDEEAKPIADITFHVERLPSFAAFHDKKLRRLSSVVISDWAFGFFYYIRVMGALQELGLEVFPFVLQFVVFQLPSDSAVDALIQILPWMEQYTPEQAPNLANLLHLLSTASTSNFSRHAKKNMGIALSARAGSHTDVSVAIRAERTLEQFGDILSKGERLQLLVAKTEKRLDEIIRNRDALIEAIESYQKETDLHLIKEHPDSHFDAMYQRGPLFDIFAPVLLPLLENGQTDIAMEFISKWLGVQPPIRTQDMALIIMNHRNGTLYAFDGRASVPTADSTIPWSQLIRASNQALGLRITDRNDPTFQLSDSQREIGVPDETQGRIFEEILSAYLQLYRFDEQLQDDERKPLALFTIPGGQVPIQAMMVRELGYTYPLSTSLRCPSTDRKVLSVLLWVTGAMFSDIERDTLFEIFRGASIQVHSLSEDQMIKEAFRREYQSAEYDVIWLATHGEYRHFEPHKTRILLRTDEYIDLDELIGLPPPSGQRRLLVLNICDGAAAASLGGINELGLASKLANTQQAVISHLWPIDTLVGAIYSAVLAIQLVTGCSFFEAFTKTAKQLNVDKDSLCEFLKCCEAATAYLCERIHRRIIDLKNLLHSGSSVYFE